MLSHYSLQWFSAAAALLTLGACSVREQKPQRRPNIIVIMTDDHTTQAISAYGSRLTQTPNLDRIAREGMRFDNCYVSNAVSGPSRACILTGKLSHINGFTDNAQTFDADQPTFPKLLHEAGYQTGMIGKWHLNSDPQGFDYWSILIGQGEYYSPDFKENGRLIREPGYVTDIITEKAINFIKHRDTSKPFALLYYHKAPHRNWIGHDRYTGNINNTNVNFSFLRYADVVLMAAEAYAETDQIQQSIELLNQVRSRAHADELATDFSNFDDIYRKSTSKRAEEQMDISGFTNVEGLTEYDGATDKSRMRVALFWERGFELCYEMTRKYDLIRWGITEAAIQKHATSKNQKGYNALRNFTPGKHELFPIPLVELQQNTELGGKNNPGY